MLGKISEAIQPFKKALIICGVLAVLFIIVSVVIPMVNEILANQTPVKSIEAKNDNVYKVGEKIKAEDFQVTAIHEDGRKSSISTSDIKLSRKSVKPIGKKTTVTITLKTDESMKCDVKVKTSREKVVSFTCGYPNIQDVKAVLYSNGELCFEGKGDIMTFDEGAMPWGNYEEKEEYPIQAVSFGKDVTPTNLNYFFENLDFLSYVDTIPVTVQSMVRTFYGCPILENTGDWSKCSVLLNIAECYADAKELTGVSPIPENVRNATNAFANCVKLRVPPDMTGANALVNCSGMFSACTSLGSAVLPPNIVVGNSMYARCINLKEMPVLPESMEDMTSMFEGDVSLIKANPIPAGVTKIANCFNGCEFLSGEIQINCNAEDFSGMFSGACVATKVNLVGSSFMLDVYANTKNDNVNNIFVNSNQANADIKTYDQAVQKEQERIAAEQAAQAAAEAQAQEQAAQTEEAPPEDAPAESE